MANRKQKSSSSHRVSHSHICECSSGISPIAWQGHRETHPCHNILLYRAFSIGAASSQLNKSWAICLWILMTEQKTKFTNHAPSMAFKGVCIPSNQELNKQTGYSHLLWKPRQWLKGRRVVWLLPITDTEDSPSWWTRREHNFFTNIITRASPFSRRNQGLHKDTLV